MPHDEQAAGRGGGDRRRSWHLAEDRQLSEELTGPEVAQVLAVPLAPDGAVDDHEEFVRRRPLTGDHPALRKVDLVGQAPDLLEVATTEPGQERDPGEQPQLLIHRAAVSSDRPGNRTRPRGVDRDRLASRKHTR